MKRRYFIKASTLAALGLGLGGCTRTGITHILTLSFDDGFKKSFYKIAEIHKEYGLKACLNIIAAGHLPGFNSDSKWMPQEILGNFDDWNKLKSRGHEIMPHTWEHLKLTEIPVAHAKTNIDKCLDYFEKYLEGYKPSEAVYNFGYNASNTELEDHALQRVRAVRTGGWLVLKDTKVNTYPETQKPSRLGCWSNGPDNIDNYVEDEVNKFLTGSGGWLILNLHGLDEEGWGPISANYLDNLLKRLVKIDYLDVRPTGEVLKHWTDLQ
ncbi:MAG: polysaccharide deacetylase family protein [Bacteroidota bacterium]